MRLTTGRIPADDEVNKDVAFIENLRQRSNLSERKPCGSTACWR